MADPTFWGQGWGPTTPVGTPGNPYNPGNFGNAPGQKDPEAKPPPQPTGNAYTGNAYIGPPTGGQPIPGDWNLQDPGAMEQAWSQHGQGFFAPSAIGQFAQQYAPQLTGGGAAGDWWSSMQGQLGRGTNAQGYYGNFEKPQVSTEAGLDPYYDRQASQAQERINRAFAARGGFGSSAATDTISDAMVGLGAEQANREADYRLRALGEQRMWEGLGGQLARGADLSNQGLMGLGTQAAMGADQSLASRLGTAGNLLQAGDAQDLAGRASGMNAALAAQGAREVRIGDAYNRISGLGGVAAGGLAQQLEQAIGGDEQLLMSLLAAELGIPTEALNQDYRRGEQFRGDLGTGFSILGSFFGLGG